MLSPENGEMNERNDNAKRFWLSCHSLRLVLLKMLLRISLTHVSNMQTFQVAPAVAIAWRLCNLASKDGDMQRQDGLVVPC